MSIPNVVRPGARPTVLALLLVLVPLTACDEDPTPPDNPVPGITSLSPASAEVGTDALELTVWGTDFVEGSEVRFDGDPRPTTVESATRLFATLTEADLSVAGQREVVVVNPAPGGGTSNPATFLVELSTGGENPVPSITGLSPDTARRGEGVDVTVVGTGFIPSSGVWVSAGSGYSPLQTTYVSQTQLEVGLGGALMENAATLSVVVRNPEPGGGYSNAWEFEVRNPVPTITSLSSTEAAAGQGSLPVTVTGTGFFEDSEVRVNGTGRPTTYVDSATLEATIAEEDLLVADTLFITVFNAEPGGGASDPASIEVVVPIPELSLLPSRGAVAGRSGFELYVHGRNFVTSSVVRWNGADRPTRLISGSRLAATISSDDVASPGTADITVHTPGAGTSTAMAFTVRSLGSATVTSLETVALAGSDLAWDEATGALYVAVRSDAPEHANSVATVDPVAASVTGSVFVGSGPGRMARSRDGQYLYVGLDGASAVRRLELDPLTPGLQWALPAGQVAGDLEVMPGHPGTVAVSRHSPGYSPPLEGVTIYDDGTARPVSSPGHTGGARIEFLDSADVLYGFNNAHTGFEFFTIAISEDGARHLYTTRGLISGFYTNIVGAAGRIYGTDGSIVDASMRTRVGSFDVNSVRSVLPDPATGRAFMIVGTGIAVYDMNTYQLLGTIPVSGYVFDHPALSAPRLVRWGDDGLAFLDMDDLYLVRSPIVAP